MAAPFMSGEDDAGGAIDLTTFGIINLDDVRRSEEFTADAAGIAVDDIAAVASELERCAHGEEVRDQIIGLALHHDSAEAVLRSEEHTSELQSLMRISYDDFCSQKIHYT